MCGGPLFTDTHATHNTYTHTRAHSHHTHTDTSTQTPHRHTASQITETCLYALTPSFRRSARVLVRNVTGPIFLVDSAVLSLWTPEIFSFGLGCIFTGGKSKNCKDHKRDQIPDVLVVGSCTSHPEVLGSIPKREKPEKTGAPCVKVPGSSRVPVH